MKRITAWLAAFGLLISCILPVQAAETSGMDLFRTTQENTEADSQNKEDKNDNIEAKTGIISGPEASASPSPYASTSPSVSSSPDVNPSLGVSASPSVKPDTSSNASPGTSAGDDPGMNEKLSPSPKQPDVSASPSVSPETAVSASPSASPVPSASPQGQQLFSGKDDWNEKQASVSGMGGIEVVLMNALPVYQGSRMYLTVSLEGEGSKEVMLESNSEKHSVLFEELPSGTYHLKISEKEDSGSRFGFLTYEQDIQVSGDIKTAEIYTGFIELDGISYTKDSPHPGVLLIGDVNRDGKIDELDKDAIMKAISRGMDGVLVGNPNENPTDLNKDGQTDLVDLQYYANSKARINENADMQACVYSRLPSDAVQVNVNTATTQVLGDPGELLKDNGSGIKLQNIDGTEISEQSPVEIGFNLAGSSQESQKVEQIAVSMEGDAIQSGTLTIVTKDGDEIPFAIENGQAVSMSRMAQQQEQSDMLTIDLRGQVAVKKVTLLITRLNKGGSLAEISKVEFLNDTQNRIPAPTMYVPKGLTLTGANKSFRVSWDNQVNVTGYEVRISYEGQTETRRVTSNQLEVKSFKGNRLKNGEIYEVSVQSVNGTWSSGYCSPGTVSPVISGKPDAPDNLKAVGGYCRIVLSWKNMEDTDSYNVYYKAEGENSYSKVTGITQNRYVISNLKDETRYEVYVTGVNELGESNPSIHSEAWTITVKPAQMPNYKLINESNGKGAVSAHIVSVTHGRGSMVSSPLDKDGSSALGTVDKDAASCYQVLDWDDGASYPAATKGLLFTLDDYYEMNYITFAEVEDIGYYSGAYVYYYDAEHPEGVAAKNLSLLQRTDVNGRKYYLIKLAEPVRANKVRLGFTRGNNQREIIISEVNFYYYDSLENDILALYGDDLHTTLKDHVTEATIDALQKRLDTKDAKSGEYHPERAMLQRELDNARGLLTSDFQDIVEINAKITAAKDSHLGFGGLNAWQPLGITAYEGEQIVVYVGHNQLKTGANSALKLIATQYHAEAGAFASEVAALKVGRNEITIPAIQSLACEGGGALYIQYTGNNENDRYAVRVSGGAREPVLNLYGVTDPMERKERITNYVKELEEHVAALEEMHSQIHEAAPEGSKVNRSYDRQNCILGATDIVLDQMMLSVSAEQILAGMGKGTTQERADRLEQSLKAMEDMMVLFYQHKGLGQGEDVPATDQMPAQHLNIRYMRMFSGAFMYAAGNHVGIEWGSVPGLASAVPVQTDADGRYVSGRYFGWGISHEIGHNINQGSYAIAEVTNNYFAQLTKSEDSNSTVRFDYEKVYEKVTSGTVGRPSNVFTHLAMYWQLHLAYDREYNYKTYDSYQEQQANLFFARVDSYSRDPSRAKGYLRLDGGADQNIMRLACAAAEKDLTEFFIRWGLVPDAETISYAEQFEKEERALYYLTDDARVYEIEHGTAGSIRGRDVIGSGSTVSVSSRIPNEVTVSIQSMANKDVILGYEIARYHYEDGLAVREVIGFTTESSYVDHVSTINNRVMTYEVTAVDQFGYRSNSRMLGDVRISHDGSHDKSMWTITTNMVSIHDGAGEAVEEDPCAPENVSAIYNAFDNDYKNSYEGLTAGRNAEILIQMNQVLEVCGLKYTIKSGTPIGDYEVEISMDGTTWSTVKTGSFENKTGSQTIYFENADKDPWVATYDTAYVRLRAVGQSKMCVSEIDLLGPSGDSISFGVKEDSTQGAVGILSADYTYETGKKIPKGSLIFTGSYKGNPAYNVVVLYDKDGNIVGGVDEDNVLKSEQIILAHVPENGLLGEVSDGIWIYWIEPDAIPNDLKGQTVRAQLYRVDHALTNEGQRIVSDTLPLRIPDVLEQITLKSSIDTEDNTSIQWQVIGSETGSE